MRLLARVAPLLVELEVLEELVVQVVTAFQDDKATIIWSRRRNGNDALSKLECLQVRILILMPVKVFLTSGPTVASNHRLTAKAS